MKRFFILAIILCLSCGGGKERAKPTPQSEVASQIAKSVLIVIAPKDFRDEEFKEPYNLLKGAGINLNIASIDTNPAKGMLGMVVKPELTLDMVNPDSFDALIICGGVGCQVLWDDTTLRHIVNSFNDAKKTIAAICIAPVVLARAGILKDKNVTAYPSVKNEFIKYGATYTGSDVEVSGNIITGSGPKAAKNFAKKILNMLK
jgi:protease I